ncbi:synaptonemal complex central element protein 2 [Pezoporus wallicus]|uniref:synaptonemal complex central element protein 2 n=1 Tax=Pezoporus wallicus TaxID=35540 RepID=UPI00254AAC21|nr:synaptonemal complex central element protein 2 [Pezoporus wallicus]
MAAPSSRPPSRLFASGLLIGPPSAQPGADWWLSPRTPRPLYLSVAEAPPTLPQRSGAPSPSSGRFPVAPFRSRPRPPPIPDPQAPVLPLTCGSVFGLRVEPVPGAEAALDAPSSRYFAALDASVGDLQHRAQHLIDSVNSSRKEDHNVMSTFRESLLLKVSGLAEQLEERLFHLYGIHNELIQERLQELAEVMERVGEAAAELRQVCRTVEAAYRDLCLQPET